MPDEKHPGGRPLKLQNVEDLDAKIAVYFKEMDREGDAWRRCGSYEYERRSKK